MVDYSLFELFQNDSVDKQIKIPYSGGTITNDELFSESVELEEKLCSESELRFGSCEASSLKFKIGNTLTSLYGQTISPEVVLNRNFDNPFVFGTYKIYSDKPTSDRQHREIIAYDKMHDIIFSDVADWYNSILPSDDSSVTLKEFRTSFISNFGLEQENVQLVNDNMIVRRTIDPSQISGKDVITATCEINGCFGHIGRNGKFQYIVLPKIISGLYPSNDLYPSNNLYPVDSNVKNVSSGLYIECKWEDFVTNTISKVQIRQEENDIGAIAGDGSNCYIVEGNFLVYGKSSEELEIIATNLLSQIKDVSYRPFTADVKGNPCYEVGDAISIHTRHKIVESYILNRTLKGIQALRDDYSAEGVEEYSVDNNSTNKSILQLKGKTNTLERDVDHTLLEIKNLEKNTSTRFEQTDSSIQMEAERAQSAENTLSGRIELSAEQINMEIARAMGVESSLSSRITLTEGSIEQEVSRAIGVENTISASLSLKIDKTDSGQIISMINGSADRINFNANNMFTVNSPYFTVDSSGRVSMTNSDVSGKLTASSGKIGPFTIGAYGDYGDALYNTSGTMLWENTVATNFLEVIGIGPYKNRSKLQITGTVDVGDSGSVFQVYSSIKAPGIKNRTSTATANIRIQDGSEAWLAYITSSSERYKHFISEITQEELLPERLYNLPTRQYIYNDNYLDCTDQRYEQFVCGLIAEEVAMHYPVAAEFDEFGRPENWNERYMIPPMLALIQKQHKDIETLQMQMIRMQMDLEFLKQEMEDMKNA